MYPIPVFDISTDEQYVSEFDPVIHFNSHFYSSIDSYEWDLGDGTTNTAPSFYHTYPDTGSYTTTLIGTNEWGCKDTAYQEVYVAPDFTLYIPTGFTPDGDFLNDTWGVKGVNILSFNLQIYNRWGQLVYETDDIEEGWDGKVNGNYCQTGAYCYRIFMINGKRRKQLLTGSFNLIR